VTALETFETKQVISEDTQVALRIATMRSTFALVAALAVGEVASHATFQDLWVNGVDYGAQCARLPLSNSPVTDVSSNNIRCNANSGAVGKKCPVKAGDTVTVEIHQVSCVLLRNISQTSC
jgi:hypothetical protein